MSDMGYQKETFSQVAMGILEVTKVQLLLYNTLGIINKARRLLQSWSDYLRDFGLNWFSCFVIAPSLFNSNSISFFEGLCTTFFQRKKAL